jgi:RNA polymerase sigma-70 factor (ECF subfamily)
MEYHVSTEELAAIRSAQRGDRAAFGYLVRQYQRRAYAAAYSVVGNRDDALELAQDAFVRAYRAMPRFDPAMPFYPWLYRIVKNVCLNHLKKKHRRGEVSLEGMMESGYDVRDTGPLPQDGVEREELRGAIQQALAQLSPEHQEILRLRHFMDLSYAEIAECLHVPQGTVMSRLFAARKGLRKAMETQPAQAAAV